MYWMTVSYIYGLICPIRSEIRYIGKSIRPRERLQNHMNDTGNCHRVNWIKHLKTNGLKPELIILEEVSPHDDWRERERYWISHGLDNGWPLTNNTSGGDGVRDLPEETRERMRKVWLGRKHSDETKKKIGAASATRFHSDERKSHMSELMKGRNITWGDKIAQSIRKITQEDFNIIFDRLRCGAKVKDIADEYGLHRTTVSKIKKGTYFDRGQK